MRQGNKIQEKKGFCLLHPDSCPHSKGLWMFWRAFFLPTSYPVTVSFISYKTPPPSNNRPFQMTNPLVRPRVQVKPPTPNFTHPTKKFPKVNFFFGQAWPKSTENLYLSPFGPKTSFWIQKFFLFGFVMFNFSVSFLGGALCGGSGLIRVRICTFLWAIQPRYTPCPKPQPITYLKFVCTVF